MVQTRRWWVTGGVVALIAGSVQGQTRGGAGFWLVGMPTGATFSGVKGISQDGLIAVGASFNPVINGSAGFRWTEADGRFDWGLLPGMPKHTNVAGCGSSGLTIAGTCTQGFYRRIEDGPLEILSLYTGWDMYSLTATNGDATVIVGYAQDEVTPPVQYGEAWRWTPATGMQGLGTLTPGSFSSRALGVSRDGSTVVGWNKNEVIWYQAFTWREGEGMKVLLPVNGAPKESYANAVNADGTVVVGSSTTLAAKNQMTRWVSGQPQDLSSGIYKAFSSYAYAVNDNGGVVGGTHQVGSSSVALMWSEATGMMNAKDYLAQYGVAVPSNYKLEYVYALSGDGRTFGGTARNANTNQFEGWVSRIASVSNCVPDCDESGKLDIDDFVCFQTFFAIGDTKADCDASGALNIDDFICFQTYFALGC